MFPFATPCKAHNNEFYHLPGSLKMLPGRCGILLEGKYPLKSCDYLFLLLLVFVFLSGCAAIQSDIVTLDKKVTRQKRELRSIRQTQADLDTRLDALQTEFQSLRGSIEEGTHYAQKASDDVLSLGEDIKRQERELNQLEEYMRTVRSLLGMKVSVQQNRAVFPPRQGVTQLTTTVIPTGNLAKVTGIPDPEELYNDAYSKLSQKDYQGARRDFKKFLEMFPLTEYSDNAQFWIGDCYYREKRYEEAILEFEEVIKKFPNGNKLTDALLKQAFSFIAIKDVNSAKLLLQKIIDKYPTSAQAEIAKAKLKTLN
ncbi:MAG: tol-pal system protein YbgF [Thermodesulfobacteriota bacterium]